MKSSSLFFICLFVIFNSDSHAQLVSLSPIHCNSLQASAEDRREKSGENLTFVLEYEIDTDIWLKVDSRVTRNRNAVFKDIKKSGVYRSSLVAKASSKENKRAKKLTSMIISAPVLFKVNIDCDSSEKGASKLNSSKNRVLVFPNPATSEINIKSWDRNKMNAIIFNSSGSVMESISEFNTSTVVNCKNYPSGIYFVRVSFEDGASKGFKIIVEN